MQHKLTGYRAQDEITGFVGIVIGYAEYVTGCNQLLLAPPANGSDYKESVWFDEDRIKPTSEKPVIEISNITGTLPGADRHAPRK